MVDSTIQVNYTNTFLENPFSIEVERTDSNQILMNSEYGPLSSSVNNFEWTLHLGADVLFGLGESKILERPFKKLILASNETNAFPVIFAYSIYLFIQVAHI